MADGSSRVPGRARSRPGSLWCCVLSLPCLLLGLLGASCAEPKQSGCEQCDPGWTCFRGQCRALCEPGGSHCGPTTRCDATLQLCLEPHAGTGGVNETRSACTSGNIDWKQMTGGPGCLLREHEVEGDCVRNTCAWLACGSTGAACVSETSDAAAFCTPKGVVGYWPFDDDAADVHGDLGGVSVGNVLYDPDGMRGQALDPGMDAYVTTDYDAALFLPEDFSIAFWYKGSPPNKQETIFAKGRKCYCYYGCDVDPSGLSCTINDNVGWCGGAQSITTSPPYETWNHVVFVVDRNAQSNSVTLSLYFNGWPSAERVVPDSTYAACDETPLDFGRQSNAPQSYERYFASGQLDELQIYDRALAAREVASLFMDYCLWTP